MRDSIGQAVGGTAVGVGVAAATGTLPFVLPLLGIAWMIRQAKKAAIEESERSEEMNRNVPVLYPNEHPAYPYASYYRPDVLKPETALASASPSLAAGVLKRRTVAQAHTVIVAGPALEFARQGRGMRARTTYHEGGWFTSDSMETVIEPIDP